MKPIKLSGKKDMMALFTLLIVVTSGAILLLAINIGMNIYIEGESKAALSKIVIGNKLEKAFSESDLLRRMEELETMSDREALSKLEELEKSGELQELEALEEIYEPVLDKDTIFDRSQEVVPVDYLEQDAKYDEVESKIYSFYQSHKEHLPMKELEMVQVKGKRIYFAFIGDIDEGEIEAIYIDLKPVWMIKKLLNTLFAIAMVVIVIGTSLVGIKLGRRLEDSEEKLKRFFSNASHELKTPLMSIQGYAEGIYLGVCTDTKQASKVILEQSNRMKELVEELLLLSRVQSGQLKLVLETINLCEIVDSVAAVNEGICKQKKIDLQINFPDTLPDIQGDEKQLFKAINCVMSNAIKFTKDKVCIEVSSSGNSIKVKIADNGEGVSEEDKKHIFERFYYGKKGSTGIGLSLAKEVIEMHRGEIKFYNQEGAVFEIHIPIDEAHKR